LHDAPADCDARTGVVEFAQLEDLLVNALASFDPLWFCAPFDESERRRALIADAAYFRAQQRDFAPGHELEDWLAAEEEIDRLLSGSTLAPGPSRR